MTKRESTSASPEHKKIFYQLRTPCGGRDLKHLPPNPEFSFFLFDFAFCFSAVAHRMASSSWILTLTRPRIEMFVENSPSLKMLWSLPEWRGGREIAILFFSKILCSIASECTMNVCHTSVPLYYCTILNIFSSINAYYFYYYLLLFNQIFSFLSCRDISRYKQSNFDDF